MRQHPGSNNCVEGARAFAAIELGGGVRQHPGSNNCVEGTDPLWRSSLSIDARSVSATRWRRLLTTSPIPF